MSVLDATPLSLPRAIALPRHALKFAFSLAVISLAFLASAWIGRSAPFESRVSDPYSESNVVRAMPFDTPMPHDISLASAGRGNGLAYHTQWTSTVPAEEIAAQFREHLAGSPRWVLSHEAAATGTVTFTLVRRGSNGYMTHFAHLVVESSRGQTVATFDFTPIPTDLAPE
jgi:hypothetical protein